MEATSCAAALSRSPPSVGSDEPMKTIFSRKRRDDTLDWTTSIAETVRAAIASGRLATKRMDPSSASEKTSRPSLSQGGVPPSSGVISW